MAAAMLFIGIANILWAERLMIDGGLGWDSVFYGTWAQHFYRAIFVERVAEYYVGRILPSAVVHYGMRLLGVALEPNRNVIIAFDIYNVLLLTLSAYVWGLIADRLQISTAGKWFGFCSLFLSYAILKANFYNPVLTDTTAFALGLLMFYFFVADRPGGLIAVMILGGFTWPTLPPMAALLYVFPRRKEEHLPFDRKNPGWMSKLNVIFAALTAASTAACIVLLTVPLRLKTVDAFGRVLRIDWALLYLSIAATTVYLYFAMKAAADNKRLFDIKATLSRLTWKRVGLAVAILGVLKITTHVLASGQPSWGSFPLFVAYTFASSVTEPLIFFVAHAVFYGPAIILLAIFWRPFCESLDDFGFGMRIFVILNMGLSINPQSRYQMNAVPAFLILLVRLLDRYSLRARDVALWSVLCLVYSKVWYVMNTAPQIDDNTMAVLLRFPLQHYFMNSGPWMSHQMYLVQASAVLVTAVLLYLLIQRRVRAPLGFGDSRWQTSDQEAARLQR